MFDWNKTIDVVAVGDTTQDIFLEMTDAQVQCDSDNENCKLMLDYADKIAVNKKTDVPAVGNAANHAIGIARMGLESAIYTVLGDDNQGHLAYDVFRENGVETKYINFDKKRGTNFSVVINFKTERTILVYHEPRDYQLPALGKTKWIYLTSSSGDGLKQLHNQVLEYLDDKPETKLAFNPGTHQLHLGVEELKPLFSKCDILFLNREESAQLLNIDPDETAQLISGFHKLGVKIMVLTDGPGGSYVSDGQKILFLPIFPGEVIERTGAGDSYGVGFLAAIIKGKEVSEAMLWGNANSTSVVKYIGAREGLLDDEGSQEMLAEHKDFKAEEFCG